MGEVRDALTPRLYHLGDVVPVLSVGAPLSRICHAGRRSKARETAQQFSVFLPPGSLKIRLDTASISRKALCKRFLACL